MFLINLDDGQCLTYRLLVKHKIFVSVIVVLSFKVRFGRGLEGPEGEQRYDSTLSLSSALDGWVVNATPRPLYPRKIDPISLI